MPPTSRAPTRAKTGAYGEDDPSSSNVGATREPMKAPRGEARQRQEADDQALHVAPQGHQQDEGDYPPIQSRHEGWTVA